MNRKETEVAEEFKAHLRDELGIDESENTGVTVRVKIKKLSLSVGPSGRQSPIWIVDLFAQAKDGRFKAQAKTAYNMRQIGGMSGAKAALSSLLYNSLDQQEEIEERRLKDAHVQLPSQVVETVSHSH